MAVLLSEVPESLSAEALPHKTWTRQEIGLLDAAGVFEGQRFELIEGELIDKMGKKRQHVIATMLTARALRRIFAEEYVETEGPIDVAAEDNARNEPEPDVTVLRRPLESLKGNPGPADIELLVEIADSVRHDLTAKAKIYARAGIREYWVLDLVRRRLHVLREPVGGAYQQHMEFDEAGTVTPLARPELSLAVAALLP